VPNDNNANVTTPSWHERIVAVPNAQADGRKQTKNALYDSYIRSYSLGIDRIGDAA